MKKVLRTMVALSTVFSLAVPTLYAQAESADSVTPPDGYTPKKLSKQQSLNIASEIGGEEGKALLVMNVYPWGSSAAQRTLANLGIAYDAATMDRVDDLDLSNYRMIMFANDQNSTFYNDYNAAKDELEDYVESGGVLLAGISDQGHNGGSFNAALPGGVTSTSSYEINNYVVDTDHPVVRGGGLSGEFPGSFASHRVVNESSLPSNSNVIIRGSVSDQATLVEYELGDGMVIASGLTWEIAVDYGWNFSQAYDDLVRYAYENSNIEEQPDYLGIATQLVEQAEQEQTQESVDAAQDAIDNVPEGEAKTELQARLDAVKQLLEDMDAVRDILDDILDDKLTSKTGIDAAIDKLNNAKKLYKELPEGEGKSAVGNDMDEAQDVIEEALLAILETTINGKPYILTGKQMTIMIYHAIDQVEASSQEDIDRVMEYLMPIVQDHTTLSESRIRGLVQLYLL
ncbi:MULTISPECIES: hypothetical protein [Brevibacillus]|uniref:Uncharacterized protein n=1 Tax=Brevibacillus invocatus TaxID=173959 RepID=A0A3M8C898_9BACL|nr:MULTISPECIES: hypothetical protein [Brevibacillus]MDH4617833.1 hypothetical protein [Brevibacillus sp. AY1]RNB71940.1 hypothetical protein EDM52_14340 [Brevibacillus invocatus]